MDKLKMQSANKINEHIEQIAALFPNCVTEVKKDGKVQRAIDFDVLRQELSDVVVEGPAERYQFTWPDKRKSILAANAPIAKTLRPCREESVDFDTTENLYIEGDNLDALKLLQETYLHRIKMIYIDPPYNTGNNLIYHNDFHQNTVEYLTHSGQKDDDGGLLQNPETNGRYQTAMNTFIDGMVREEDRETLRKISSCAYIRERLEKEEGYSYRFQVTPMRGMQYFEMRILRARTESEGHFAIMTSRNVDESAREELRAQREIEEANKQLARALAAAESANESKSNFISNVSHDMRTPLNAILGYDRLALETDLPELRADYLRKIGRAGQTLLSLINDTLDLQKIENGVTTLHPEPLPCSDVVNGVLTAVKPMLDAKQIQLVFDNSRAAWATINIDAVRVEEIFINLISNAVKFTPAGGTVLLAVECEKETETELCDKLTVRDSGIGISPEFLPKIYEPFSQERTEKTASIGGSGLGLSIVKRLVDLMHGSIEVKSTPGEGTEFTVRLTFPKASGAAQAPAAPSQAPYPLRGKTILLCEDNEMNREIASAILEKNGLTVLPAVNGQAGVEQFLKSGRGEISAILMDIRMPVMDGFEAARAIRTSGRPDAKTVPIIALSADAYAADIQKAREYGMTSHLSKPIDPELLLRTLRSDIQSRQDES